MTTNGWLQIGLFLAALLLLAKPLGAYMARVYSGQPCGLDRVLGPVEKFAYRLFGRATLADMSWVTYATAVLLFNLGGLIIVYVLQRVQHPLPLNPRNLAAISPDSSFNTAISFASNTNWQGYAGESTMSHLTQMLGLTVQNFVSAATGMACLVALIRGFSRKTLGVIGNFWVDLTRSTLYILLPLSFVLAIVLVSQGAVQTWSADPQAQWLDKSVATAPDAPKFQSLAVGPAASQVAIKQLGTNGGGFFNVNSAHPYENPTPLANFLEVLAILIISAALCFTFGEMIGDRRQGHALLAVMLVVIIPFISLCYWAETRPNASLAGLGIDQSVGNMEGKDARFGVANSALWAVATTAASNGSVNAMHDSFTPLGGLAPMVMMQLGEVIFGGVGSGLYGLIVFAIIAVFIAGLMVGRTPEYLGKKIEAYEMKMASIAVLVPCAAVLLGTAIAVSIESGRATIFNPGPHGFSEVLYAFSSAGNNNGSAFAGLGANTPFYNVALGFAMLVARYWIIVPVLAIAGSLAHKKSVPVTPGTLPTHTPLFAGMLVGVILIVGALTFVPALALGPVVEHLMSVTN